MSIEFSCNECRKLLRVPETSAGKKARCPACGSIQEVPSQLTAAPSDSTKEAPDHSGLPTAPSDSPFAAAPKSANPFADSASAASGSPFVPEGTNPYAAPVSGAGMVSQSRSAAGTEQWARTCVEGPANSLVAISGLVLVFNLISFVFSMASMLPNGAVENAVDSIISTAVVSLPYVVVLYGALRMKQLENYPLAIAASILAMLPCSGCCILGLPIGIWSLVVLSNSDVRATFR